MSALRTLLNYFGYVPASELHAVQSDLEAQREHAEHQRRNQERQSRDEKNALWHNAYRRGKAQARQTPSGVPLCPNEECTRPMTLISRANWICLPCAKLPDLQPEQPPAPRRLPPTGGPSITTRATGEFAREATGKPYRHQTQDLRHVEWPTTDKVQTWQRTSHDL